MNEKYLNSKKLILKGKIENALDELITLADSKEMLILFEILKFRHSNNNSSYNLKTQTFEEYNVENNRIVKVLLEIINNHTDFRTEIINENDTPIFDKIKNEPVNITKSNLSNIILIKRHRNIENYSQCYNIYKSVFNSMNKKLSNHIKNGHTGNKTFPTPTLDAGINSLITYIVLGRRKFTEVTVTDTIINDPNNDYKERVLNIVNVLEYHYEESKKLIIEKYTKKAFFVFPVGEEKVISTLNKIILIIYKYYLGVLLQNIKRIIGDKESVKQWEEINRFNYINLKKEYILFFTEFKFSASISVGIFNTVSDKKIYDWLIDESSFLEFEKTDFYMLDSGIMHTSPDEAWRFISFKVKEKAITEKLIAFESLIS